nr:MAG TPA: hypothetical protein [Caudoviricetes sp.]
MKRRLFSFSQLNNFIEANLKHKAPAPCHICYL